ncbi:replicative DNA helicase [Arachidicoccus rhizosphaerae]|uniref:Replicative DNA helicase n=1 Tax=Arachidicoccus rhizosphaerae TaxID=551991 RepID=A0A1H3W3P1_9BACT|nr:replicative DNA helicase [Arachidicoccus rhizosphaerae]SDZ81709.1 replicative DNA helicase [Arachidicoccus rhizosphaerae]
MKELEQFVPLHSQEVEESVIGIMIQSPNLAAEAFDTLVSDYFYTDSCKRFFKGLKWLYDSLNTIDVISLVTALKKQGTIQEGDVFNLSQIVGKTTPLQSIFDTHSKMLIEYYMKRKVGDLGIDFLTKAKDETADAFDVLNGASVDLMKVQEQVSKGDEITISQLVDQVFDQIEQAKSTGKIGLDTKFTALNKKIMGWVAPDLIILAARPGMGKTALMLSAAKKLAIDQGIPVAIFSIEMSSGQLVTRLLSIETQISHEKIRLGDLNEQEEDLLNESGIRISNAPLHIIDNAMTISEIRTKSVILKRKYGIKMIFIDYLQIMSGMNEKNKNREAIVSEISRGCKRLAKELEVPVMALSQLSRGVESRENKMPMLSDLRESGAIEQDADEVIFLMRPEYYEINEVEMEGEVLPANGLVVANVAKNRHGSPGKVVLGFTPHCMTFKDHEKNIQPMGQYEGWTPIPQEENPF